MLHVGNTLKLRPLSVLFNQSKFYMFQRGHWTFGKSASTWIRIISLRARTAGPVRLASHSTHKLLHCQGTHLDTQQYHIGHRCFGTTFKRRLRRYRTKLGTSETFGAYWSHPLHRNNQKCVTWAPDGLAFANRWLGYCPTLELPYGHPEPS